MDNEADGRRKGQYRMQRRGYMRIYNGLALSGMRVWNIKDGQTMITNVVQVRLLEVPMGHIDR